MTMFIVGIYNGLNTISYNACQKSLEHLGHFFIIRTSNHSYEVQMPPRPRNNVAFESYCPSIPAESRIVLTSRISDHKTTLFQGGEGEIAKQGKISGGVPRLLAGIVIQTNYLQRKNLQ